MFAPALKAPNSLLREAEASGVSAFRTEKFGRRKFNVLISNKNIFNKKYDTLNNYLTNKIRNKSSIKILENKKINGGIFHENE